MPIYDENDVLITQGVSMALSHPDVIEIKNRTLDGKYHVQTIGTAGTLLDVEASFTHAQKLIFETIKRASGEIKVVFDGRYYIGVIDGQPSLSRIPNVDFPMFGGSFTLMVNEEGVV